MKLGELVGTNTGYPDVVNNKTIPNMQNRNTDSNRTDTSDRFRSRRSVLTRSGMFLGVGTAALTQLGTVSAEDEQGDNREQFIIQEGTEYETDVFVRQSSDPDPTAVVISGFHGNEVASYRAADNITNWEVNSGTLIVIPRADAVAVRQGRYSSSDGNLNRKFPTGEDPQTALAREIWGVITNYSADLVIDMHTSRGIWGADNTPSGYGQAVFPTPAGRDTAAEAIAVMNDRFMDNRSEEYEFTLGNNLSGDRPLLIHKVAGDLGIPGYLSETTRYGLDYDTQTHWHERLTKQILEAHGLEVTQRAICPR